MCACKYVCMNVCMYVYMCKCKYVYIYIYACKYMCMYVCMHVCMYICECKYVCIYVCMYICMRACTYEGMFTNYSKSSDSLIPKLGMGTQSVTGILVGHFYSKKNSTGFCQRISENVQCKTKHELLLSSAPNNDAWRSRFSASNNNKEIYV